MREYLQGRTFRRVVLATLAVLVAWDFAGAKNHPGKKPPKHQTNGPTTFTEYVVPTPNSIPLDIVLGPDGFIWFTEFASGKIGRVSSDGTMFEVVGPVHVTGLTGATDGNIYLTDPDNNSILQLDPKKGQIKNVFPVGAAGEGIAQGSDGALWFAEPGNARIGRMLTNGIVTHYDLPSGGDPKTIRRGPDGNLWFTEFTANKIARLTSAGVFTEFSLPSGANPTSLCSLGTNVWFTEFGTNTIAKISTTGANTITRYALPPGRGPRDCAGDPSTDTVYFTESTIGGVGQIDDAGNLAELGLSAQDRRITLGNDDAMWITEPFANQIARLPLTVVLPD